MIDGLLIDDGKLGCMNEVGCHEWRSLLAP